MRVDILVLAEYSRFVKLLLMTAERSWAAAMAMKSAQSTKSTQKPTAKSTRRHIISKLNKATQYANHLVGCLGDGSTSRATAADMMEAAAYLASLRGAVGFEKGRWNSSIREYSVARVIYATLGTGSQTDLFKDLLSSTIDPSIRYAAYQLKISRTKAVSEIAVERFPDEETELRKKIGKIDPNAFETTEKAQGRGNVAPQDVPSTIVWRKRSVKLEDANIAQAIAVANKKERELSELSAKAGYHKGELAAAYDEVIIARQQAADATKSALDELTKEGVDMSDSRVQSLQLTRTAVNCAVIELRIGRSRVLCGAYDEGTSDNFSSKRSRIRRNDGRPRLAKRQSIGTQLAKLRERAALYDSILQNVDAVKDLPGVVRDSSFMEELTGKRAYFRALKYAPRSVARVLLILTRCLTIGHSYAITGEPKNALALYARALELSNTSLSITTSATNETKAAVQSFEIASDEFTGFHRYINGLVSQYRGLVELKALADQQKAAMKSIHRPPLAERLDEYPIDEVESTNLVNFPPKLQPVPVKPLFLDLAWNYIDYPGRSPSVVNGAPMVPKSTTEEKKEPAQRRWFGFGR